MWWWFFDTHNILLRFFNFRDYFMWNEKGKGSKVIPVLGVVVMVWFSWCSPRTTVFWVGSTVSSEGQIKGIMLFVWFESSEDLHLCCVYSVCVCYQTERRPRWTSSRHQQSKSGSGGIWRRGASGAQWRSGRSGSCHPAPCWTSQAPPPSRQWGGA